MKYNQTLEFARWKDGSGFINFDLIENELVDLRNPEDADPKNWWRLSDYPRSLEESFRRSDEDLKVVVKLYAEEDIGEETPLYEFESWISDLNG